MDNGGNFEYRIDNVKVRQKKLMAQFKPVETSNTLIINIIWYKKAFLPSNEAI